MEKKLHMEERIVYALTQAQTGTTVAELMPEYGREQSCVLQPEEERQRAWRFGSAGAPVPAR